MAVEVSSSYLCQHGCATQNVPSKPSFIQSTDKHKSFLKCLGAGSIIHGN